MLTVFGQLYTGLKSIGESVIIFFLSVTATAG